MLILTFPTILSTECRVCSTILMAFHRALPDTNGEAIDETPSYAKPNASGPKFGYIIKCIRLSISPTD
jgi:hypothetical protein